MITKFKNWILLKLIPKNIFEVAELLRSQHNRFTDQPLFIVQQKIEYVTDEDYNDSRIVWRRDDDYDYAEVSELRAKRLESIYQSKCEVKEGYNRYAVMDVWEFVTACFTEQGCKDFIAAQGHNLNETQIYADGSFRNREFQQIRKWLMSLPKSRDKA